MVQEKYKNLIINAFLFAINAFATKFIVFLLVPLYTYYMSTEEYGITDMSLTVVSLITPLATLSIADAAVRFIIGNRSIESRYAAVSFIVTCISVLVVILTTPVLDLSIFGGLGNYKVGFVFAYLTSAFLQFCSEVARGRGEVRLIPFCAVISSMITCLCAILFIGYYNLSIVGYFISVSIGPLAAVVIYFSIGGLGTLVLSGIRSLVDGCSANGGFVATLRPMLEYSLPLIPNSLFWWISTSINRFFITAMIGIGASGLFAAASKLPGLINTAYSVFQQAWQLSAFQEAKREGLEHFFSQVFQALQVIMLLLCSLLAFVAPQISSVFLQGKFYDSWPLVTILLLSNLLNVFNAFYGTIYTTTMQTAYIMKTTAYGALACMGLTPLLIIPFGVMGACIASCCGNALVLLLRGLDSRKYLKLNVGLRFLIPSLILIALQAVFAAVQFQNWQFCSALILIIVFCMSLIRVGIFLRHTKAVTKSFH